MNKIICPLAAVLIAASATAAYGAGLDTKFNRETAKKVWAMDMPEFDANVSLTDSIYLDAPAVFIARYYSVDARYVSNETDYAKYTMTHKEATNRTDAIVLERTMVKVNTPAAVENYSTFTIETNDEHKIGEYVIASQRQAFGARVIKPDGTVRYVDVADAKPVVAGKKNSEKDATTFKLAIEGLEQGDVVDFFNYTEDKYDELSMPVKRVNVISQYPTRRLIVDYIIDTDLTVEYRNYNGAPLLAARTAEGEEIGRRWHFGIELENIDGLEESENLISYARQMPFYRIAVLNNHKPMLEYFPKSARVGGVQIPNTNSIATDIGYMLADLKTDEKTQTGARNIAKSWRKNHPDATEAELVDAAWMATIYSCLLNRGGLQDYRLDNEFINVLSSLGIKDNVSMGVSTTLGDVAVSQMVRYNDPDYFVKVGDRRYFLKGFGVFAPGESTLLFGSCEAIEYPSPLKEKVLLGKQTETIIPAAHAKQSSLRVNERVTFAEGDSLHIACDVKSTGADKYRFSRIVGMVDLVRDMEKFLGTDDRLSKQFKTNFIDEMVNRTNAVRNVAKELVGVDLGSSVPVSEVKSLGGTPDNKTLEFSMSFSAGGLVTEAGNRLIVNIGKLIGENRSLSGKARTREIDAVFNFASNQRYEIELVIPEGYTVAPAAVEALNRSVVAPTGSFVTNAELLPDNVLSIKVLTRVTRPIVTVAEWPEMLKVLDAISDFTSASVPLVKK